MKDVEEEKKEKSLEDKKHTQEQQLSTIREREIEIDEKISKCQELLNSSSPMRESKSVKLQKLYEQLTEKKLALVTMCNEI